MASPLISVILPVFNTEKYVRDSIASVLAQTYSNIEVICVNDGSTDGSLEALRSFADQITIVNLETNGGIANARNQGISRATGEYIAFMDADDLWEPNKLEVQMAEFDQNKNLDICFCHMQCFLSPDLSEEVKALRFCPPDITTGYIPPATLVKRSSFDLVGRFNAKWNVGEFIDWFERAKDLGLTYICVDDVLLKRRIHETNTGVRDRASRSDYLKIIRESLERKKKNAV